MKLNSLNELRSHLLPIGSQYRALVEAHTYINTGEGKRRVLTGWKALRMVIVGSAERGVRCCSRKEKTDDEIEIMLVRKIPADKLDLEIGLTDNDWDRVVAKCAKWLEKNNMYIHRETITDKTGDLFDEL